MQHIDHNNIIIFINKLKNINSLSITNFEIYYYVTCSDVSHSYILNIILRYQNVSNNYQTYNERLPRKNHEQVVVIPGLKVKGKTNYISSGQYLYTGLI